MLGLYNALLRPCMGSEGGVMSAKLMGFQGHFLNSYIKDLSMNFKKKKKLLSVKDNFKMCFHFSVLNFNIIIGQLLL